MKQRQKNILSKLNQSNYYLIFQELSVFTVTFFLLCKWTIQLLDLEEFESGLFDLKGPPPPNFETSPYVSFQIPPPSGHFLRKTTHFSGFWYLTPQEMPGGC